MTSVAELGLFGRSRFEGKAPAPDSASILSKTEEILNDILLVHSHMEASGI